MPLEAIALEVVVSKSALLHHVPNGKVLIRTVTEHAMRVFHSRVLTNLNLSENYPGTLLRAYIRTLFSKDNKPSSIIYQMFLQQQERPKTYWWHNARTWDEGFATDGLHPDRLVVVSNAAEGFIAAAHWCSWWYWIARLPYHHSACPYSDDVFGALMPGIAVSQERPQHPLGLHGWRSGANTARHQNSQGCWCRIQTRTTTT